VTIDGDYGVKRNEARSPVSAEHRKVIRRGNTWAR